MESEKNKIFISYRRRETAYHAVSLRNKLYDRFGTGRVFIDIDSIEPGEEFPAVIEKALGECQVLVALIEKDWLTVVDEEGRRRLDDPGDFVRLEISTALARKIRVIPVLFDGVDIVKSPMPTCLRVI